MALTKRTPMSTDHIVNSTGHILSPLAMFPPLTKQLCIRIKSHLFLWFSKSRFADMTCPIPKAVWSVMRRVCCF